MNLSKPGTTSSAMFSLLIFAVLFLRCANFSHVERKIIDYRYTKMSPERWFDRVKSFWCSNYNPDFLIIGSSVGLIPSIASDIRRGYLPHPQTLADFNELSVDYLRPALLEHELHLQDMKPHLGAHIAIPASNITDELIVLEKTLSFGKRPAVVVLATNERDFIVPPQQSQFMTYDDPVKREFSKINSPLFGFSKFRLYKEFLIYGRFEQLMRTVEDWRFYFIYRILDILKKCSCMFDFDVHIALLKNRIPEQPGIYDKPYSGLLTQRAPLINPDATNRLFSQYSSSFAETQFSALSRIAELTKKHEMKLVVLIVPLCPGVHAPKPVAAKLLALLNQHKRCDNVEVLDEGHEQNFPKEFFFDALHLNDLGGERLLKDLAQSGMVM